MNKAIKTMSTENMVKYYKQLHSLNNKYKAVAKEFGFEEGSIPKWKGLTTYVRMALESRIIKEKLGTTLFNKTP